LSLLLRWDRPRARDSVRGSQAGLTSNDNSHVTDNILRVGVNYRFGGPVAAKY